MGDLTERPLGASGRGIDLAVAFCTPGRCSDSPSGGIARSHPRRFERSISEPGRNAPSRAGASPDCPRASGDRERRPAFGGQSGWGCDRSSAGVPGGGRSSTDRPAALPPMALWAGQAEREQEGCGGFGCGAEIQQSRASRTCRSSRMKRKYRASFCVAAESGWGDGPRSAPPREGVPQAG
jgi:hypothetical protein